VIDVTNPVEWNPNGGVLRALPRSTTAREVLARKLPNARVVKALVGQRWGGAGGFHE
jgi:predicted dinucleotide-binding enzyme